MSNMIIRKTWPAVELEPQMLTPPGAAAVLAARVSEQQACSHLGDIIAQRGSMAFERQQTLRQMIEAQCEIARIDADREIEIARIERQTRVRQSRDHLTANIVHAVMAHAVPRTVSRISWREREGGGFFRSDDYRFELEID